MKNNPLIFINMKTLINNLPEIENIIPQDPGDTFLENCTVDSQPAKLQVISNKDNNLLTVKVSFSGEINQVLPNQFKILEELSDLLSEIFSEQTNNDACSFIYGMDTDHLSGDFTFSATITDYLS